MMKKIIEYLRLAFIVILLPGCVDLLQEPNSFVTPETIIYDKAQMESLTDGLYKTLWNGNYGYNNRMQAINVRADELIVGNMLHADKRLTVADELSFDATALNTDVTVLYSLFFSLIQNANQLVEGIESDQTETYAVRKTYIAEARFMRAFAYFNLVRLFGDVPASFDSKFAKDILGNTTIGRNKVIDIYEKVIIPDLIFAEQNLLAAGRKANNSTASIDAAKLCLADVYLNMAGWPLKKQEYYKKAQYKAAEVIRSTQGYKLIPEYADLWREDKKSSREEHIFALNHSKIGGMASNFGTSYISRNEVGNAWQDYMADSVFFENYPADKRRDINFVSAYPGGFQNKQKLSWRKVKNDHILGTERAPGINKYRDFGAHENGALVPNNGGAQTDGITPIYRFADALFIYAESQNRADGAPNDSSYLFINNIRKRAYRDPVQGSTVVGNAIKDRVMADTSDGIVSKPANGDVPVGLNMVDFEKVIFNERGWEFFAEFKRWFELVRTERVQSACSGNPRVRAAGNLDNINNRYLPLPINEVALTGWSNNPGY